MAYTKSTKTAPIIKTNTKYPKRLSKRESRVTQGAVDTVLNDTITISAAYTPTDEIKTIIADAAAVITLPASASSQGRKLMVHNNEGAAAVLSFTADGSDTAPALADASDEIADGEYAEIQCVGTVWVVLTDTTA